MLCLLLSIQTLPIGNKTLKRVHKDRPNNLSVSDYTGVNFPLPSLTLKKLKGCETRSFNILVFVKQIYVMMFKHVHVSYKVF